MKSCAILLIGLGVGIITTSCGTTRTLRVDGEPRRRPGILGSDVQSIVGYRTLDGQRHAFIGAVRPTGDSLRFERRLVDERGITRSTRGEVRVVPRDSVVLVEGVYFDAKRMFLGLTVVGGLVTAFLFAFMPKAHKTF